MVEKNECMHPDIQIIQSYRFKFIRISEYNGQKEEKEKEKSQAAIVSGAFAYC